jgi:transcriptional regulator with PAS, ATPase and Fis domain
MIFNQIFDMIDIGLVILDKDLKVRYWNRWLASHSGIAAREIKGSSLFDFYPHLQEKRFLRNFKAVISLGNCYFFPQKQFGYIFPFKPQSSFVSEIDYMQQSCIMGPLRDSKNSIEYAYISVKDVTEAHIFERKVTTALFALVDKKEDKEKIPPPVQSVLSELLSFSGDEFLAKYVPPQQGTKSIASVIEKNIGEIISPVK